jgi:hypothetical protein
LPPSAPCPPRRSTAVHHQVRRSCDKHCVVFQTFQTFCFKCFI